jgi:hypothetical protein
MTTLAQFAIKCRRFPSDLQAANVVALRVAAKTVDTSVLAAAEGQRWPAKPNWVKDRVLSTATAIVELRGGFPYMFEGGAVAHTIVPKRLGKRAIANRAKKGIVVANKAALSTPYGPRAMVRSPGFKGREFWFAGIEASRPLVAREYQKALQAGMLKAFG